MKRFIGSIQIAVLLFCGAAFCWGSKKYSFSLRQSRSFAFQFDALFCNGQRCKIKDFFQSNDSFKTLPLHELSACVRKKFPSIQSLVLFLNATGTITAQIKSVSPLCKVNDTFVLVDDGKIFKSALFSGTCLDLLNHVYLSQSNDKSGDVAFDFLQAECVAHVPKPFLGVVDKLSASLFDDYSVTYQNKAMWCLRDKQQKNFFILFNSTQMPNEHVLAACNTIKETLFSRGQFDARRMHNWVADTRFKDQIILFRKTGGV